MLSIVTLYKEANERNSFEGTAQGAPDRDVSPRHTRPAREPARSKDQALFPPLYLWAVDPDNPIAAIKHRVEEINDTGAELFDGLRAGDLVFVQEDPLKGYEAIFDAHISSEDGVRVLLRR